MIRELARQKFKETNEKARYVDWSSIFNRHALITVGIQASIDFKKKDRHIGYTRSENNRCVEIIGDIMPVGYLDDLTKAYFGPLPFGEYIGNRMARAKSLYRNGGGELKTFMSPEHHRSFNLCKKSLFRSRRLHTDEIYNACQKDLKLWHSDHPGVYIRVIPGREHRPRIGEGKKSGGRGSVSYGEYKLVKVFTTSDKRSAWDIEQEVVSLARAHDVKVVDSVFHFPEGEDGIGLLSGMIVNSPLFPRYFQHHTISEKAEKIGMSTLEDDQ